MFVIAKALRLKHFLSLESFRLHEVALSDVKLLRGGTITVRWTVEGCDLIHLHGYGSVPGYVSAVKVTPAPHENELVVTFDGAGKAETVRHSIEVTPLTIGIDRDPQLRLDHNIQLTGLAREARISGIDPTMKGLSDPIHITHLPTGINLPPFDVEEYAVES